MSFEFSINVVVHSTFPIDIEDEVVVVEDVTADIAAVVVAHEDPTNVAPSVGFPIERLSPNTIARGGGEISAAIHGTVTLGDCSLFVVNGKC